MSNKAEKVTDYPVSQAAFERAVEQSNASLPVVVTEAILPRSKDPETVRAEALTATAEGKAEAFMTIPASAHVVARVARQAFGIVIQKVLHSEVELPSDVDLFAEHFVVWFQRLIREAGETTDFVDLYNMSTEERAEFINVITAQCVLAWRLIQELGADPLIWGTVGFADFAERIITGLARGGPSSPLGHLHVEAFDPERQGVEIRKDMSAMERYKFMSPWDRIILERTGENAAQALEIIAGETIENFAGTVSLELGNEEEYDNQAHPVRDGLVLDFGREVRLEEAFDVLINFSGVFDQLYQHLMLFYADHHKTGQVDLDGLRLRLTQADIDHQIISLFTAEQIIDFVLSIKPTRGQLETWLKDMGENGSLAQKSMALLARHVRMWDKLRDRADPSGEKDEAVPVPEQSTLQLMAYDTIRPPYKWDGMTNWPVRFSFSYHIEPSDARLDGDQLFVRRLRICPALTTSKTVERLLGVYLKRDQN